MSDWEEGNNDPQWEDDGGWEDDTNGATEQWTQDTSSPSSPQPTGASSGIPINRTNASITGTISGSGGGDVFMGVSGSPFLDQPLLDRHQSYEILSKEDLLVKQESMIASVREQLWVSREEAAVLLRFYRWKMTTLVDDWLTDSEAVRKKVGLTEPMDVEDTPASPSPNFTCPLCLDTVPFDKSDALACGHRYCGNCWQSWLSAENDKGPQAIFTNCMALKCKEVVSEEMMMKYLPVSRRDIYQSWLMNNLIQGNRHLKWCPHPGCEKVVEYKSGGMKEINCRCGHVFCFKCGQEGHRPAECELVEKWILKNSTDAENVNWILANTKKCPNCGAFIEKNQGCNHMTCRGCKHEFCWLCKGPWSDHGSATGGFYKCNKYDAGAKGTDAVSEETKAEEARNALQKYMFYFTRYDNHDKSIKFAENTRAKAEKVMAQLQDKLGTNYQDVQFVLNAVNAVIACRRVLKWTYCFGYYLEGTLEKQIFENHQERLEKFTEELHGLTEKPIEDLLETKTRTQIVNHTRVVEKYRKNVIEAIENGLRE